MPKVTIGIEMTGSKNPSGPPQQNLLVLLEYEKSLGFMKIYAPI